MSFFLLVYLLTLTTHCCTFCDKCLYSGVISGLRLNFFFSSENSGMQEYKLTAINLLSANKLCWLWLLQHFFLFKQSLEALLPGKNPVPGPATPAPIPAPGGTYTPGT